jgi:hypothetical protein
MAPLDGFTAGAATGSTLTVTATVLSKEPLSMRIWACGGVSAVKTSDAGKAVVVAGKVMVAPCGAGLLPRDTYGSAMQLPS